MRKTPQEPPDIAELRRLLRRWALALFAVGLGIVIVCLLYLSL